MRGPSSWRGWLRRFRRADAFDLAYDRFMLHLHDRLKQDDAFQERSPKKCWQFPPGAAWLVFTDGIAHAELRGRFVLEFGYRIALKSLVCPELAPFAQFQQACTSA